MEKELFIALCDQLKNKVPELRWIDSDQGQLNVSERPPVAFPCCLVEMSYPQCTTHMAGKQRVRVRFQLQVAFNVWGTANASAPQESREKALQQYDTLQNYTQGASMVVFRTQDQSDIPGVGLNGE